MQIYLARNNQQAGPYSLEQLNQMLASQQVLLTDLMWHVGMQTWQPIGELTQGQLVYQPRNTPATATPVQPSTDSTTDAPFVLASLAKRALAKVIDVSLWFPAFLFLTVFMSAEQQQQLAQIQAQGLMPSVENQAALFALIPTVGWLAMGGYLLIMLFVQATLMGKTGQSIGKKVMDIQIVDAQNQQLVSLQRVFFMRSVLFIMIHLFLMPFSFLVDWAFINGKKKQALHDRLAKTIVIDKK